MLFALPPNSLKEDRQSIMASRKILVTGATGKQGGAVVEALINTPSLLPLEIVALTRNTESAAAKKLASHAQVTLLAGNMDQCEAIFDKAGGHGAVWGVFAMQTVDFRDTGKEEQQGKALVDAALAAGVQHFVYSSVDRGGANSDHTPTPISHFIAKHHIEQHLKTQAGDRMTWTILRPVAFMENLTPDFIGRTFAAMWMNMGDTRLQLVATKDIGAFAAIAFAQPVRFKNTAISLAGDSLTQAEGNQVFVRSLGRPMPRSWAFVGRLIQWMMPELGTMFQWFVDVGYGANIAECKQVHPGLLDLGTWLKEESKFVR